MLQLLELLLVDGVHLELLPSCPTSIPVDLLSPVADKDDAVQWQGNVKCMLQGIARQLSTISSFNGLIMQPPYSVVFVYLRRIHVLSGKRSR